MSFKDFSTTASKDKPDDKPKAAAVADETAVQPEKSPADTASASN